MVVYKWYNGIKDLLVVVIDMALNFFITTGGTTSTCWPCGVQNNAVLNHLFRKYGHFKNHSHTECLNFPVLFYG